MSNKHDRRTQLIICDVPDYEAVLNVTNVAKEFGYDWHNGEPPNEFELSYPTILWLDRKEGDEGVGAILYSSKAYVKEYLGGNPNTPLIDYNEIELHE